MSQSLLGDVDGEEGEWELEYPSKLWKGDCQSGKLPNLTVRRATIKEYPPLEFKDFDKSFIMQLANNGHSIVLQIDRQDCSPRPTVSGGELNGEYIFDHIHLHWPAVHGMNCDRDPLEIHIVTFSSKYNNFIEANENHESMAIFSVFCKTCGCCTSGAFKIIKDAVEALTFRKMSGPKTLPMAITLRDFLPNEILKFLRYVGPNVTPPCYSNVTWTVFADPLYICPTLLTTLKNSMVEDNDTPAFRFCSNGKENKREVFKSFECSCSI